MAVRGGDIDGDAMLGSGTGVDHRQDEWATDDLFHGADSDPPAGADSISTRVLPPPATQDTVRR